jgi:hypothetical protein
VLLCAFILFAVLGFSGMTTATAVGLFLIPGCYVFEQQFIERGGKKPTAAVAAAEAVA